MADPPPIADPKVLDLIKTWGPSLAAGLTEERITPFLPQIKEAIKGLTLAQKVTLANYLQQKAPYLSGMVEKLLDAPPRGETPPKEEPDLPELTEDEEAQIAQYAEQRSAEGKSYRGICEEVNASWRADFEPLDLRDLVARYRVIRYNQERKLKVQTLGDQVAALQEALRAEKDVRFKEVQAEKEAHLATKTAEVGRLLAYRDSLVFRWGASLVGALGVGLAVGRLLR